MYLAEVAFSFDWFLTIPGLLITCGVILLIIALIMFLVGSSKNKKENVEAAPNLEKPMEGFNSVSNEIPSPMDSNIENVVTDSVGPQPFIEPVEAPSEELPNSDVAVSEPMGPIAEDVVPQTIIPEVEEVAAPVENIVPQTVETAKEEMVSNFEPVEITPIPEVEMIPTETIVPATDEVSPLENADVNPQDLEKTSVNIYGEVEPITTAVETPEEVARPIYGGADPLEATQNMPQIDVRHEPYSGGKETTSEEVVTPEVTSIKEVTEIPEIQPIVEENPIVEPVVEEPTVAPVEIPTVVEIPETEDLEQL